MRVCFLCLTTSVLTFIKQMSEERNTMKLRHGAAVTAPETLNVALLSSSPALHHILTVLILITNLIKHHPLLFPALPPDRTAAR